MKKIALLALILIVLVVLLGACAPNVDENPYKGQINQQLYQVGDRIELVARYENAPYNSVVITMADEGVTISFDGNQAQSFTHFPWAIINGVDIDTTESGGYVIWFKADDWAAHQE